MFFKVLEIYKKLRDDNKKDIPFNIKVLIGLVTIDFILLFVCEINKCNVGVIITYCISVIITCITCILADKFVVNNFDNIAKNYNDEILKEFEKMLIKLKIGSSACISTLIDECKEYEKIQKDTFLTRLKYILGIAVVPLITSAGSLFILNYNDEQKIGILILAAISIVLIFYIFNSLYELYRRIYCEYNILARNMRYDLELILAQCN